MDIDNQQNSTKEIFILRHSFYLELGKRFCPNYIFVLLTTVYNFYRKFGTFHFYCPTHHIGCFLCENFQHRSPEVWSRGGLHVPHDSSCSAHFMLSTSLMKVGDQLSEIQISTCWSVLVTEPGLDGVDILKYIKCSVIHRLSVVKHLRYNEVKTPYVVIPPRSCAADNDVDFLAFVRMHLH